MEIKLLEAAGFCPSMLAMRLPMKSGDQSDSQFVVTETAYYQTSEFVIGKKDHKLSMKLIKAGASHRKHIRLIDAWFEIKASRAFWSEFDTYRYGVDKVSESTMHRIMKDEITIEDFTEETSEDVVELFLQFVEMVKRHEELTENEKLNRVKSTLPEGYMQKRIVKLSYEALHAIYHDRRTHRLKQWQQFCDVVETLPYSEFITEKED